MNFNNKLASVALLTTLGIAAQASTFDITFQSRGTYTTGAAPTYTANDDSSVKAYTNTSYSPSGFVATDLTYGFSPVFATPTSLVGTESDGKGTLTLKTSPGDVAATIDFTFTGTVSRTLSPSSVSFSHLALTFSNGTGWLTGYTGTGALSSTLSSIGRPHDQTTFNANLQAVPEPASMAVLGLGVLGLVRRRRSNR